MWNENMRRHVEQRKQPPPQLKSSPSQNKTITACCQQTLHDNIDQYTKNLHVCHKNIQNIFTIMIALSHIICNTIS